uniref:Tropomodulin n=1 Tax=Ditylenchus dipsaci TaxID=166011 RepID=A0A915E6A7_9BILA
MSDENEEHNIEVMTDADFERALDALREEGSDEVGDLLKLMNENQMISWEEAERIMGDSNPEPVKSSLPAATRPTEPDNDTDVDSTIQRLYRNDPKLVEINLNNMKRTPIPQVKRILEAMCENTYMEKLSLANMGLYDMDIAPLLDVIENNDTLRCLNSCPQAPIFGRGQGGQPGVAFSTTAEKEIIDAIFQNKGLTKISINLRLPEGRHKVEQATIRNQEIRRILRRQAAAEAAQSKAAASTSATKTAKKPEEKEQPTTSKAAPPKPTTSKAGVEKPKEAKPTKMARKPSAAEEPEEETVLLRRKSSGSKALQEKQVSTVKPLAVAGAKPMAVASLKEREKLVPAADKTLTAAASKEKEKPFSTKEKPSTTTLAKEEEQTSPPKTKKVVKKKLSSASSKAEDSAEKQSTAVNSKPAAAESNKVEETTPRKLSRKKCHPSQPQNQLPIPNLTWPQESTQRH